MRLPEMIGRRIISTEKTKEPIERFPLAAKAVAYSHAEGTITRLSGTKTGFVAVNMGKYAEASEQWTREFTEDAHPHAIDNIELRISMALAAHETQTVLDRYSHIEEDHLAGGDAIDWRRETDGLERCVCSAQSSQGRKLVREGSGA